MDWMVGQGIDAVETEPAEPSEIDDDGASGLGGGDQSS